MMEIKHVNFAVKLNKSDNNRMIFCKRNYENNKKKTSVVEFDNDFVESECKSGCPYYIEHSADGVVCAWDDNLDSDSGYVGIFDPKNEIDRNKQISSFNIHEKNKEFEELRNEFYKKNNVLYIIQNLICDVKDCRECVRKDIGKGPYLVNPFQFFSTLKFLQPYTTNYWTDQCFSSCPDIVIMGQDWGNVMTVKDYDDKGRKEINNQTRENLEEGINRIKCKDRSIFINSVMCLREGKETGYEFFKDSFIDNCRGMILKHLKLLKPKIVVTMGEDVTERYLKSIVTDSESYSQIASKPYWDQGNNWFVFPIFHLGNYGIKNRQRYKAASDTVISDFLTDFDLIKWLLISYYFAETVKDQKVKTKQECRYKLREKLSAFSIEIDLAFDYLGDKWNKKASVDISVSELCQDYYASFTKEFFYYETHWFINVGEAEGNSEGRNWDDNKKFGYISFGHGGINLNLKDQIKKGDYVFAYISGYGYVGFGQITSGPEKIGDFERRNKNIKRSNIKNYDYLSEDKETNEKCEYMTGVNWLKVYKREDAKKVENMFVSPSPFCKVSDRTTIGILKLFID